MIHAQQWVNCTSGHKINDILQDGNVTWTATTGGLVKNNLIGDEPEFFNRGNSPIPSNNVWSLATDADGDLWVSTDKGTAVYDGSTWQVFYEKSGLLHLGIDDRMILSESDSLHWWDGQSFESIELPAGYFLNTAIEVNPNNGDIWLTYYTFGTYVVYKYANGNFTEYSVQNSVLPFESAAINPLIVDNSSRVWAGTTSGLFRFENNEWKSINDVIEDFPEGGVTALDLDSEGNIWACVFSPDAQLVKINENNDIEIHPLPSQINAYPSIEAIEIIESPSQRIQCGSWKYGVWEYDFTNWQKKPTDQSPAQSNNITQLFIDGETTYIQSGRYLGNDINSLFFITNGDWMYFDSSNYPANLNIGYPPTVLNRNNDTLWIHMGDSLYAYVNDEWVPAGLPDIEDDVEEINSFIHYEEDGKRWLLERWQSFIFYETDTGWKTFEKEEHSTGSGTYDIYFNHPQTGDFWLSSANGISRYDGTNWHIIKPKDLGLGSNWAYGMEVDENGIVWANTYQAILRIENNVPTIFTEGIPGYEDKSLGKLTFDEEGRLWIGMDDALAVLDNSTWQVFDNTNSGVPNGRISELEFDQSGNLWLGSWDGGFAVYNPDGLPDHFLEDFHFVNNLDTLQNEPVNSYKLFPNPVSRNEELNVELLSSFWASGNTTFLIYNSVGQVILQGNVNALQLTIPMRSVDVTGTYILEIKNGPRSIIERIMVY